MNDIKNLIHLNYGVQVLDAFADYSVHNAGWQEPVAQDIDEIVSRFTNLENCNRLANARRVSSYYLTEFDDTCLY
ncbi:hypothetical protein [Glutamicibacter sp. AOP33-2CA-4]|uniref:hypothetical protein n=1 Tax=Glutamicibacter sp. AOP33-2CA-4 TaxID=3457690 RepID=UPI004034156E